MRDNSRKGTPEVWAKRHYEVARRIFDLLENGFPDVINQWELRVQDRTDESHVLYIQTVHDRLAGLVATPKKDTEKA